MPTAFVGHGSPMNAIETNTFSEGWREMAALVPRPSAILCVSAHWLTKGSYLTGVEKPETIHDFYGFPKALYEVQYPAPGAPALANETASLLQKVGARVEYDWGLDHGTWSVLIHMFPNADIPVYQLSIDVQKSASQHYHLAKELASLRQKGVFIVGSGNIVHNLQLIDWDHPDRGTEWAAEFDATVADIILKGEHDRLFHLEALGRSAQLSVPTPDHYLPLLYILALQEATDSITFFNERLVMGSLSMRSLLAR